MEGFGGASIVPYPNNTIQQLNSRNNNMQTGFEFNKTFFREVSFNDLKGLNGGFLRYDFKVMLDDEKFVLIEFDGEQHYRPVKFDNTTTAEQAVEAFKVIRTHDRIKDDYCKDNGFELLRIKYDQMKLIGVMVDAFIGFNKITLYSTFK